MRPAHESRLELAQTAASTSAVQGMRGGADMTAFLCAFLLGAAMGVGAVSLILEHFVPELTEETAGL